MKLDITPVNKEMRKALKTISVYDHKSYGRIEKALEDGVKSVRRGAESRVSVNSGKLKKSIFSRTQKTPLTGYIGARAPHAHLVEFGVKKVDVDLKDEETLSKRRVRKGAKVMTVKGNKAGGTGYGTKIEIPARSKRPFMQPAFEEARPKIVKSFEEAVQP